MTTLRTFNGTTRGSLHILRNAPCEDSSVSYSDPEGQYYIAIVSDGHGDSRCFRSQYGSDFATKVSLEALKEFANYALQNECTPLSLTKGNGALRQITDTIVARWYDEVTNDFHNAPPTEEELSNVHAKPINEMSDDDILHIYGATLIAALWLPNMLLLFQQGDGRCDVFYEDGSVDQPIPWDDRCINTTTTSLCDPDADERFRSCVIDLQVKSVVACYLASDGVEDAYRDSVTTMEGTHTFFKFLSTKLCSMDDKALKTFLDEFLPEFSRIGLWGKSGSGDDVSVAGIINMELLSSFQEQFAHEIQKYELSEMLFWKTDELNGKTRKYEILKRRMDEAAARYEEAKADRERVKRRLTALRVRQAELIQSLKEANQYTEQYMSSSQKATVAIEAVFNEDQPRKAPVRLFGAESIGDLIKDFLSISSLRKDSRGRRRKTQDQIFKDLQDCDKSCTRNEKEYEIASQTAEEKKSAYNEAKENYKAYEASYNAIEEAIKKIRGELDGLEKVENQTDSASDSERTDRIVSTEIPVLVEEPVSEASNSTSDLDTQDNDKCSCESSEESCRDELIVEADSPHTVPEAAEVQDIQDEGESMMTVVLSDKEMEKNESPSSERNDTPECPLVLHAPEPQQISMWTDDEPTNNSDESIVKE